jgi:hypothetical protein
MKITLKGFENLLRKTVGYLGMAESISNTVHAPASVRVAIATVSGVILAVDHYLNGTTPPKP